MVAIATGSVLVRFSDLIDGQEAECFALLSRKTTGVTKRNETYYKCYFRDRFQTLEAPVWASNALIREVPGWMEGVAYRLHVRVESSRQYGLQLNVLAIRPATEVEDGEDGFQFGDLVESSKYSVDHMVSRINAIIDKSISDRCIRQLVCSLLDEHASLFRIMPAAASMHHGYTSGLLEHVWSMARISSFLSEHYASYYCELNPPINKSIVVAAAILHDIGKIRELEYHPAEAKYTKEGSLIGHVLMGRDMVREAARKIDNFPDETLLLLEHAILAHHGKKEFGAPILPQTIEAYLVSEVDDLDAKMNAMAVHRLKPTNDGEFTDKVYSLDNRRIYRGIPLELPEDPALDGY